MLAMLRDVMERGQTEASAQLFHETLTVRNAESDNFCITISQDHGDIFKLFFTKSVFH